MCERLGVLGMGLSIRQGLPRTEFLAQPDETLAGA